MKTTSSFRALFVLAAFAARHHAAAFTWDGGATLGSQWSRDNNWVGDNAPLPSDTTADLHFAGSTRLDSQPDEPWSMHAIIFDSGAGEFIIDASTGFTLSLGNGGINNNGANDQIINHPSFNLVAPQTWATNSTGSLKIINGGLNTNGNLLTLQAAVGTTITIGANSGSISGTGGVTKTGLGTVLFSSITDTPNTYTGVTTVNAGSLQLNKPAGTTAIAGPLVIGDGTGSDTVALGASNQIANSSSVTVNSSGALTLNSFSETIGALTVNGGSVAIGTGDLTVSSAAMTGGNITSTNSNSFFLNGDVATNANGTTANINGGVNFNGATRTFTVADGTAGLDLQLAGETFNGGLTKAGPGTMRLSGTTSNLHLLTTTVAAGTLELSKTGGVSAIIGPLSILTNGTVRLLSANQILDSVDVTITSGSLAGGILDLNGFSEQIDALTMTGGAVTTGAGTLTLGGVLTVNTSVLGASITGNFNLSGAVKTFTIAADNAAVPALTLSANVSNGGVTKAGVGTLRLDGATPNTYTGTTTVNAGTLELNKTAGVNAIAGNLTIASGARVDLLASDQLANTSNVTIIGGTFASTNNAFTETIGTLTFTGGFLSNMRLTLGGDVTANPNLGGASINGGALFLGGVTRTFTVADDATSAVDLDLALGTIVDGGLTKSGAGTLRLGLTDTTATYTGPTTVNAGTLIIRGRITGSTVVNNSATLGGTGIAGPVSIASGGSLSPGESAGTFTIGNLSLASGAFLRFELKQAGTLGGVNDLLLVNGTLTLDGTLVVTELSGFGNGTYSFIDYSGTLTNNGLDLQAAFLAAHPGSSIQIDTANTRVDLVVVPEPSSLALLALGVSGCVATRTRRARP